MEKQMYNDVIQSSFDVVGFFEEIFVGNKFMGCIPTEYQPERKIGYAGRTQRVVVDTFTTTSKKCVKNGTIITTYYFPVCGKIKK